ncbi:MAG: metallophosphoesterase [candidate division KSB1 bacterium]|nr:metallophosphoesterase [candidate division KSB1 bacterium]MDZ7301122.1 metallophosphoesterase [candidate division KSB1 bacterium]MDZ7311994.1 metallophosphoesterase [candidate division KSB1 bacterium]
MKHFFHLCLLLALAALMGCHSFAAKPAFKGPEIKTTRPWSNQHFRNQTGNFQFAIVADRTGGMRPGVFEQAVKKLNLLQPEFVMSVGDLIDGYTENDSLIDAQWEEFEKIISVLQMPFFRVPGNHDLSNAKMTAAWEKRFGPTYYHFLYHDVLFLCLNTEDPPPNHLSEAQTQYFEKILARHKNVRWTLVFMHKPFWAYSDQAGYEKITALLQSRPHTIFSGHEHHYLKSERRGMRYFTLATTGGVSDLRGVAVGEFDHLLWVTMTDSGPVLANLELSGIHNENIVTDSSYTMVQSLREGAWFSIDPVINATPDFTAITTMIRFTNPANRPMRVVGKFQPKGELYFSPDTVDLTVAANSSAGLALTVRSDHPVDIAKLEPIGLELSASYERETGAPLSLSASRSMVLDWQHPCPRLTVPVTIDGDPAEWNANLWLDIRHPGYVKEDWDWQGPEDGWFRFVTAYDENYLYLAIESFDNQLLLNPNALVQNQDKFLIELDARNDPERSQSRAPWDERGKTYLHVELSAGHKPELPVIFETERLPEGVVAACRQTPKGLTAEIAIPIVYLQSQQDKPWQAFRLNVGYMDHDNATNTKPSIVWWQPPWSSARNYSGSGTFHRK